MAGLLDIFGGGGGGGADDPYADILTPAQRNQMQVQGLLAMAGAFAQAGMPSRLPVPFGSALGSAAAALGTGSEAGMKTAIENALAAQKVRDLRAKAGILAKLNPLFQKALEEADNPVSAPPLLGPGVSLGSPGAGVRPVGVAPTAAPAAAPLMMDLPYPPGAGGGLLGGDVGAEGEYGAGQKIGGLLGPAPPPNQRAGAPNPLQQSAAAPGGGIIVDGVRYPNARAWRLAVDAREAADPSGSRFNLPATGTSGSSTAPAAPPTSAGGDEPWGPTFPEQAAAASGGPLDVIARYESGGRNINQQVVGPQGGYNPSVGRVTGPSSASGPWQMLNSTWRENADLTGVDTKRYPRAIDAPEPVQRQVAQTLFDRQGYAPWAPYNANLARAIGYTGGRGPAGESSGGGEDAGWGPTFAQGGPDRVIPSGPAGGGNLPITQAQYRPQGGAAVPGMPQLAAPSSLPGLAAPSTLPPLAPPGGTPALGAGGKIPGLNMTPQKLAIIDAMAEAAGLGNPFKGLLETYYKSPGYLQESAGATARGRIAEEEPSQLRVQAAKARTDFIQKLSENALTLDKDNNPVEIPGMRDMLGRTAGELERAKQEATSKFQLTDARVIGPDGQPTTTKMPIYEYIFRQQQAARNAAMGAKPQPGDIISAPISGPPPEGYQFRMDPQGNLTSQPIPGSPQEDAQKEQVRKRAMSDQQMLVARDIVVQNADRLEDLVRNSNVPVTGVGSIIAHLPIGPANDARVLIETMRARASLDALNQMRQSSPTGAALGNVSNAEGDRLAAALSNLDQSQSRDQFLFNLNRAKQYYIDTVHGPGTYAKLSDAPVLKTQQPPVAAPVIAPGAAIKTPYGTITPVQ